MARIFNLEKLEKSKLFKRGGAIIAVLTLAFSLGACSNNTQTPPPAIEVDTDIESDVEEASLTYSFAFNPVEADNTEYAKIDWKDTEKLLSERDEYFANIIRWEGIESNHNYEIAVYEYPDDFDYNYYTIVDKSGLVKNGLTYKGNLISVCDGVSILQNERPNSSDELDTKYTYTLFNHNTGITKEIKANSLSKGCGYIFQYNRYKDDKGYNKSNYKVLNADGTLASEIEYDNYAVDEERNCIFLSKDGVTEVIDVKHGVARKIDVGVQYASNGFLVIGGFNSRGVSYLKDLESDLVEKIPRSFDWINFAIKDETNPIFECTDYDLDKESATSACNSALYSVNNERLSNYYTNITMDLTESGYLEACTFNDYKNNKRTTGLINKYGVEVLSNIDASYLCPIKDTNLIMFKSNGENAKHGIIDMKGKTLIQPVYDSLLKQTILDKDGNPDIIYFIGRINNKKLTVIFDSDLNEIARGDYRYSQASNIAFDTLIKGKQKTLS